MSQSLYTGQVPVVNNGSDGAPGIVTATTMHFAVAGSISAVRFFASNAAIAGTWTVAVWQVTSNDSVNTGTGTLLSSQTFAASGVTSNAWNNITLPSPVSVTPGTFYRIGLHTPQWYVATNGFFASPLTNGDITADANTGARNNGSFIISPTLTYPTQVGTQASYFIDVLFDATGTDVTLAANLTATAGMSAGLRNEARLSTALTATAGMSAAAVDETTLRANLGAAATLAASMSVPSGPVDPIGSPVAQQLLMCLEDQLSSLPSPPKYIQLRVGQETGPLIGANVDECCAGLAWVRISDIYPSWDSFPGPDNTWLPCGPLAYAVVLEMGVAFCMPWSDSDDSFESADPPNEADWAQAFQTQMQHQTLMRRAAACCFLPTQRRAVGAWSPLPVEGGCTGGKMTVTVSVMAPCSDC